MRPLTLLVSLHWIRPGPGGGIADYTRHLIESFAQRHPDVELHLIETFFSRGYVTTDGDRAVRHFLEAPQSYTEDVRKLVRALQPDLVFYPVSSDPYAEVGAVRYATVIPDLQHDRHPEYFPLSHLWARAWGNSCAIRRSDYLVTLSEYSRRHIESKHPESRSRVHVLSPALAPGFREFVSREEVTAAQSAVGIGGPYLIYPANFWKHKNHRALIEALAICRDRRDDFSLVLTGDRLADAGTLRRLAAKTGVADRVHFTGYVHRVRLEALLHGARGMVFPSYFEGFGIPLLEAFAARVPVACADRASLPEVAGDAALLFDPDRPEEIADCMSRLVSDDTTRHSLIGRGTARAAAYSYARSADDLYEMVRAPAERRRRSADSGLPLVSIVTPSRNQARFIRETIESVLRQDYPNIEYFVIDGASTDETVGILRSYGDRIRWISELDAGQAHAINKGLRMARGDFLAYLNSDDTLAPGAIRKMVEFLMSKPQTDLVYGDADMIDAEGRYLHPYHIQPWNLEAFRGNCFICQPATMWRRRCLEAFGGFDESLHFAMDYEYWMRIAVKGGVIDYLPGKLANAREHPTTKTQTGGLLIYEDVANASRRHFGSLTLSWRVGRWLRRLESSGRVARALGKSADTVLSAPQQWLKLRSLAVRGTGFLVRSLRKLVRTPGIVHSLQLELAQRLKRSPSPVCGYAADGWVGERLEIRYPEPRSLRSLAIAGLGSAAQRITIAVDDQPPREFSVPAGEFACELDANGQGIRHVEVRSELRQPDGAARPGFRLLRTNLFSDLDLGIH